MANAFMVSGLTKTYQDFVLDHVSFTVPSGSIVGLIGENGAGKSTTINAALGLIQKEDGVVSILDKEELDGDIKEKIGVVFDGSNYPEILSPRKLNRVMKNIYGTWDEPVYLRLLKQFSLPADKQIKQFSKGMKMKLAISAAFSHHSRLLILDEATSGLDPVVRDDILDMLLDFVQDEGHSILVSSHITSDLEKIADYIVFIHEASSSAVRRSLMRWINPISFRTAKWTMNGRYWFQTGSGCRKSIRRLWSFRQQLMKLCCFM